MSVAETRPSSDGGHMALKSALTGEFMNATWRLQQWLTEPNNPRSLSARARAKRWREFISRFPDLSAMRVLDLGGLPSFWRTVPQHPAQVVTVNIADAEVTAPWLRHVVDDACAPNSLRGERFDLVVSNSLLEHVGGYARRRALASVIHEYADLHWVQTPYRFFPIEPHWAFPGMQFLPVRLQTVAARHWPLSHGKAPDHHNAVDAVLGTELLSLTEMRLLFPKSTIWHERVLGLTKSLVAVQDRPASPA
ncbi:hypothetical protein GCM10012275_44100 [Longimycelium tulufanense]|uniref:Methyltransferase type 11 domain-containing protein n=1 Tax=Longimycelium tulufanense TaxID=907463 RepID=A0A8J3CEU7_9PSEU|nr:class I SAM-dependent methyltransferase [Longimycelium tulufanense]GGM68830.1 hypothetical protein GCM10012275_44100 [Longimycelium tulufanense]